jgi:hypothetical protein
VIEYPDDGSIMEEAERHGLPEPVLIRDLVRIVEVMNLKRQGFFGKQSVLAGSMALRCFGSPRFTVYDADFSTTEGASPRPDELQQMLAYEDDDLVIAPAKLTPHDARGTAWKSEPIRYEPVFTTLAPDPGERSFKADVSFRGLVCEGIERELGVPYGMGLWSEPPTVWVMDPHEVAAEKILGWCVNRMAKHYADLGFIGLASQPARKALITLDAARLRDATAAKLGAMRGMQPSRYAAYDSIDRLADDLDRPPKLSEPQWRDLVYVRGHRDRFKPELLVRAVRQLLVPKLRGR